MSFKLEKVTATQLGLATTDSFCPRCFWLKSRCGFKIPFNIFPKIFEEIDLWQKAITECHLKVRGKLPAWMGYDQRFEIITVPDYGKFTATHSSGLVVSGKPDHILCHFPSPRDFPLHLVIGDYKTAKVGGSFFLEAYRAQLNIYRWMCQTNKMGIVDDLFLLYYEPMGHGMDEEWMHQAINEVDPVYVRMGFRPFKMKVDIDETLVDRLVRKVQDIAEGSIPGSLSKDGVRCKDCQLTEQMYGVLAEATRVPLDKPGGNN